MKIPAGRGLFARTFVMFLLVPVCAVTMFTFLMIPRQQAAMMRSLENQVRSTIAAVVNINSAAFIREDYPSLVDIGALVTKENESIRYMVTSRRGGQAILNAGDTWATIDLADPAYRWLADTRSRTLERNPLTGERVFHYAYPVRFFDLDWGTVSVGISMKTFDAQIRQIYLGTLAICTGCVLLSALLAWYFTRRITNPVLHLNEVAERIQAGELGVRAVIRTGDELEQLAEAFNATTATLGALTGRLEARVEERTRELQRSEDRYRLLFDNAAEAIFVLRQGRVRFWNPVLPQLTGCHGEALTGARFAERVVEADRMAFLELLARAEATVGPVLQEGLRLEHPSGEPVWVDVNCVAIRWEEDPALLVFMQDVSERRTLQTQFFHAQKMEALGTLAGGIAHDFNNLLGGILGYVSLLLVDREPDSVEYKRLKKIENQIDSATGLTRQLLGFARGGTYETKPRDLNMIVRSAMELFGRTRPELRVELDLAAAGCAVDCDQGQIEQLLLNLFVNAGQAMQGGGVLTVRTRVKAYGPELTEPFGQSPGWFVELEVQDTGVGMDETTQARIFEPFFTTKKLGGGTGLGLASVYGILKNHHGLIRVRSQLGAGSTFTIALALSKASIPSSAGGTAPEAIKRGEDTVLVIDDQEIIRTVTQDMLEMIGCRVFTAAGGAEGVALFETRMGQIDLVILDMIMPGMGGAETFRRLRALDPRVPVLLASGYSVEGEVARLLAAGCNGFLQKPFNAAQLSGKIREVLRARETTP